MREEMISQCLEIVMGDKIEKSMKGHDSLKTVPKTSYKMFLSIWFIAKQEETEK